MKAKARKAMETNWLADHVGEFIKAVQPYSKAIVGLLLAVLVICAALAIMARRTESEQAAAWNNLWSGLLPGIDAEKSLAEVADSSAKLPPTDWANLIIADGSLNQGVSMWFTEKTVGRNLLNDALGKYQTVYKNSTDPMIREHALYGIGRAEESLCKLDAAHDAYEQLRRDYPSGSYAVRAKQRLDSLARETTKARYDWFAQVQPPANVFKKDGAGGLPMLPEELGPPSDFTTGKLKTPPPEPKPDTGAAKKPTTSPSAPAKTAPAPATTPAKPAAPPATNAKPADKSAPPPPAGKS